jgi:hypothetical protein
MIFLVQKGEAVVIPAESQKTKPIPCKFLICRGFLFCAGRMATSFVLSIPNQLLSSSLFFPAAPLSFVSLAAFRTFNNFGGLPPDSAKHFILLNQLKTKAIYN